MKTHKLKSIYTASLIVWLWFAFTDGSVSQTYSGNSIDKPNCEISIITATEEKLRLKVIIHNYNKQEIIIENKNWNSIDLAGEALIKQKSFPELPKISRSIQIPGNAGFEARVISVRSRDEKTRIAPSKGIISRQDEPCNVPYVFGEIYSRNTFYPEKIIEFGNPYLLRNKRGVVLNIYPFACNPQKGILRIYEEIDIEVRFTGAKNKHKQSAHKYYRNPYFDAIYSYHFLNYRYLNNYQDYTALEDRGKMLVICYDDFMDEILPLVYFKNNRGLETDTVSMSVIGSTAEDIEDYIQNYYDTDSSLTFVLLVGDHTQVPSLIFNGGGSDPSFALVSGSDNYPDIIVGRFSAETEAQVETMVERTIQYENMTEQEWFHGGMGIASDDGTGNGDDNEYDWEHLRNIRTDLLNYHYTSVAELYEGSQGGEDAPGDPTDAMVGAEVNDGVSVINYTGHGSITRWSTSGFSSSDVNVLTNTGKLPFIFSVACVNGDFTDNTCFGESWIRATDNTTGMPTGAIGFYGSSINQDWSPPMEAQDEFNALLVSEGNISFGALCFNASCSMMDKYGSANASAGTKNFLTWIIFGDPSLSVIPNNLGFCNETLSVTDSVKGGAYLFKAADSIVASNIVTVNAEVSYSATERVRLLPGFKVDSGCYFAANNYGCSGIAVNISNPGYAPIAYDLEQDLDKQNIEKEDDKFNERVDVSVYPNPITGEYLYIRIKDRIMIKNIRIYNAIGESIYHKDSPQNFIMLSNVFKKGMIFLRLEFTDRVSTHKIIVL